MEPRVLMANGNEDANTDEREDVNKMREEVATRLSFSFDVS